MSLAKGTVLDVLVHGEWVRAKVEFRITRGEPLGHYSFYREDGGGRITSCLCKTRNVPIVLEPLDASEVTGGFPRQ